MLGLCGAAHAQISAVESIAITSAPANGSYYVADETVEVTVTFIGNVTVAEDKPNGKPGWRVKLRIGDGDKNATWVHGSAAGATGRFGYTVAADDEDTDGISILEGGNAGGGLRLVQRHTTVSVAGFYDGAELTSPAFLHHAAVPADPLQRVGEPAGAPGAPGNLRAAAQGESRIDLSWQAPADPGSTSISGYRIDLSDDGGSTWTVEEESVDATAWSHTGLAPESTWHYRVLAINAAGAGPASAVASAATTVAIRRPVLSTASVVGDALTLTYDAALDAASTPAASAFTVAGGAGASRSVTAVAVSGSTVTLTVSPAAAEGETGITVSYAVPATNPIQFPGGGSAASLADHPVANRTRQPRISGIRFTSDAGADGWYGLGGRIAVTVTFDTAVAVTGAPRFGLQVGNHHRQAGYHGGSGTPALRFHYDIAEGDQDLSGVGYRANALDANGGAIKDHTTRLNAILTHGPEQAASNHKVDARRPTVTGIARCCASGPIAGTFDVRVTLRDSGTSGRSEGVRPAGESPTEAAGVTVVNGSADGRRQTTDSGEVEIYQYRITPDEEIRGAVTVGVDENAWHDRAGNGNPAFEPVSFNVDTRTPALSTAVANAATLTLTWNKPLDEASVPPAGAFAVAGGDKARSVTSAALSGNAVTLTLAPPVENGEADITVTYTVPTGSGAQPIRDLAQRTAAALAGQAVTNATPVAAPGAPSDLVATPAATRIDLAWTAPANHGGVPVDGYRIEVSEDAGATWTTREANTGSTATAYAHTPLPGGVTRHYRVSAHNSVGFGPPSNVANATTLAAPGAPVLTATAGDGQVTLNWTAPAPGSHPIGRFEYRYKTAADYPDAWIPIADSAALTAHTVTGLVNKTIHTFQVRAVNDIGPGPASNAVSVSPVVTFSAGGGVWSLTGDATVYAGETYTYVMTRVSGTTPAPPTPQNLAFSSPTLDEEKFAALGHADCATSYFCLSITGSSHLSGSYQENTFGGRTYAGVFQDPAVSSHTITLEVSATTPAHTTVDLGLLDASAAPIGDQLTITVVSDAPVDGPNSPPAFDGPTAFEVDENTATAGTVTAADGDDADGVTGYAVTGGADQARFSINSAGVLTFDTPPDHERPADAGTDNVYDVVVTAASGADSRALTADQAFTVTVADVSEPPGKPDAPRVEAASPASLTVTWGEPANTGPDIEDYDYRYRVKTPQGNWTEVDDTTIGTLTATIGGLASNTAYDVQVRATNAEATGAWSPAGSGATLVRPAVTLVLNPPSIREDGGESTVTATVSPASPAAFTVTVSAQQVDPAVPEDFTLSANRTLRFDADATASAGTVTITAADNAVDAADKSVTVSGEVSAGAAVAAPASVTLTIADNDEPDIAVALEVVDSNGTPATEVGEDAGTLTVRVTATTAGGRAPAEAFTVNGAATAGTASSPGDYAAFSQAFAFAVKDFVPSAGRYAATKTASLVIEDDRDDEDAREHFTVALSRPAGLGAHVTLPGAPVTVTILDNDELPEAPANLAATAGNGEVTLTWTAPGPARPPVTGYEYRYKTTADFGEWTAVPDSAAHISHVVTGLDNGVDHVFELRAVNTVGPGAASEAAVQPVGEPGAPRNLRATPGNARVTLHWDAPASDGGSPVTDYEYRRSGADWTSTGSTSTRFVATVGLINGTDYRFDVRAVNEVGPGPATEFVNATPAATVPEAPAGLTATAGFERATLTWTAPGDDGGEPISSYEYRQDGGAWVTTGSTATRFTVTGLTNGQTYAFRVRARNTLGAGDASNEATAVPALSAPDAPGNLRAAPGNKRMTLTWDAPASDGGRSIDDYEYQVDAGAWTSTGAATPGFTVTGLDNGTVYAFKVRAVNGIGPGAASSPVSEAPARAAPDAPKELAATAGFQKATLTWRTPDEDGGAPVDDYQYRWTVGSVIGGWTSTSAAAGDDGVFTHVTPRTLTNGVQHTFDVRAVNEIGAGAAASAVATPAKVAPEAPRITAAIAAPGAVTLRWAAPADDGGSDIIRYEYRVGNGAWTSTGTATRATIGGLTVGENYTFQVRAVNDIGAGAVARMAWTPQRLKPSAPRDLAAVAGDAETALSWREPESDGGAPVTGYEVRFKVKTDAAFGVWTAIANSANLVRYTVTGLTNGKTHVFELRAVNAVGRSDASPPAEAAPRPVVSIADAGGREDAGSLAFPVTLSSVTTLTVTVGVTVTAGTADAADYAASAPSVTVSAGQQGAAFTVTIVDDNADEAEETFGVELHTPANAVLGDANATGAIEDDDAPPGAPTGLTATAADRAAKLAWTAPDAGSSAITAYRYRFKTDGAYGVWTAIANSASLVGHTVTGLAAGTRYTFQVRAVNTVDAGPASNEAAVTPITTPGAPASLAVTAGQGLKANLAWTAPTRIGYSAITGYAYRFKAGAGDFGDWTGVPDSAAGGANAAGYLAPDLVLVRGVEYTVELRAVNAAGGGAAVSETIRLATAPLKPTLTADAGDRQVTLRWTADDGGVAIRHWEYRFKPDGGDFGGWIDVADSAPGETNAGGFVVEPLANGTPLVFEVRAENDVGEGPASDPRPATPGARPGAPTLTVAPGDAEVTLAWNTPDDGGFPILRFEYSQRTTGTLPVWTRIGQSDPQGSNANGYAVTGLTNGTLYGFGVRAVNARGDGQSSAVVWKKPSTVPRAPTNLEATAGDRQVTLTWTKPTVTQADNDVTSYQYQVDAGAWVSTGGAQTSVIVTGLGNHVSYTFGVRAVNVVGAGAAAAATATPVPPDSPTLSVAPATVEEGDVASFTVTLSPAATVAVTVTWSTEAVTATAGEDFTAVSSATFTIDASATAATIQVATTEDELVEPTERFRVRLASTGLPEGVTLGVDAAFGAITDDDTAPRVTRLEVASEPGPDQTYAPGDTIRVKAAFDRNVTVTGEPRLALKVGDASKPAAYAGGSDATHFFEYAVVAGDADTDGVSIDAGDMDLNGGRIRDSATNDAALAYAALPPQAGHKVDGVKPVLLRAKVAGATLTLTWDEALDGNSTPGNGAFALSGGAAASRSVTRVAVSGATVSLTLNPAVTHDETGIKVGYAVPTGTNASPLRDAVGNAAAAFSGVAVTNETADADAPTVASIASGAAHPTKDPFAVTVTFSEAVTGLTANEIEVTQGVASNFAGSGAAYTLDIEPTANFEGDVTVTVPAGVAQDDATNGNVAKSQAFAVDTKAPALVTNGAAVSGATLTLTFDEALAGSPAPGAFTLGGDTARSVTAVSVSGSAVRLTVGPAATHGETGITVTYTVPAANPLRDAVGNNALAFASRTVTNETPDTTAPTLTIASSGTHPTKDAFTATIIFSEAVTGLEAGDVTVANGTGSNFSGSGAAYTLDIEPTANFEGDVTVTVAAGAAEDDTENGNARTSQTFAVDTKAPGLAATDGAVVNGAALTLTFHEALAGSPAPGAFTLGGDTSRSVTAVSVSGTAVRLTVNPAASHGETGITVTYTVPSTNPLLDAVGNAAAALADRAVRNETPDTTAPTLTITSSGTHPTKDAFTATIIFSEAVTGLEAGDVTVANGTGSNFSGSGTAYTLDIEPTANFEGDVTVTVAAGAAEDDTENGNARTSQTFAVDTKAPGLAATDGAVVNGAALTLTWHEALAGSPAPGAFTLGGDTSRSVTAVSVSGAAVRLTVNPAAAHGETGITVTYTVPSTNPLLDAVGNAAAALADRAVRNETPAPPRSRRWRSPRARPDWQPMRAWRRSK